MKLKILHSLLIELIIVSCSAPSEPIASTQLDELPSIYPDYTEVTVPANIAPLRFKLQSASNETRAVLTCGNEKLIQSGEDGKFLFPENKWKDLLAQAAGKDIGVRVYEKKNGSWAVYREFPIHVAREEMDSYLAYRLIAPGYEPWFEMGIYQRELSSFKEYTILQNGITDHNCMNCHTFNRQNPEEMVMHMRKTYGGTYIYKDGKVEKLNGKVSNDIPSLVYPCWHPSGDFIAFSSNQTLQNFHMRPGNRIEVYDKESNIVVFDLKKKQIVTADSILFSKEAMQTFPNFSPDGKTLYFCSARADSLDLPADYEKVKYSLCSISFNAETRTFGTKADTLYQAEKEGRSAKFPRVSPDGNFLVFTLSDYGNFSIWHHDADLYIYDLRKGTFLPLQAANSEDTESFHSWSHNSRWLVFSSRREDGLYTRPYFTYIDTAGISHKPFLLPQSDPDFYQDFMRSFNVPEFIQGKVQLNAKELITEAKR